MLTITWKCCVAASLVVLLAGCSSSGNSMGGDVVHGQKVAQTHCAACHDADGNSTNPAYPRLAGLNAGYLYRQLLAFGDGTRPSQVMASIVAPLSDGDMRDSAEYYAGQSRVHDAPGPAALMAQGRRIFLHGSSDGQVLACAACHESRAGAMGRMGGGMHMGHMMSRMNGGYAPSLYGQHAQYVVNQLDAFAKGTRPATVMGRIARTMTAQQIQAVAEYLASHP